MDAELVKKIVSELLPRIEKLMAAEVTTWEQLTLEQQEELNVITLGGLERIDIKKRGFSVSSRVVNTGC